MSITTWSIYLSGEIHTDWREKILKGITDRGLPVEILSPIIDHDSSDNCGTHILGQENDAFWKDHKGAKLNSIRTKTLIQNADIVIVRFGDKFRQWNAAFDAGYAAALGTPFITLHDTELDHPLKEIDGTALAVAKKPAQIVDILSYVIEGKLF